MMRGSHVQRYGVVSHFDVQDFERLVMVFLQSKNVAEDYKKLCCECEKIEKIFDHISIGILYIGT